MASAAFASLRAGHPLRMLAGHLSFFFSAVFLFVLTFPSALFFPSPLRHHPSILFTPSLFAHFNLSRSDDETHQSSEAPPHADGDFTSWVGRRRLVASLPAHNSEEREVRGLDAVAKRFCREATRTRWSSEHEIIRHRTPPYNLTMPHALPSVEGTARLGRRVGTPRGNIWWTSTKQPEGRDLEGQ